MTTSEVEKKTRSMVQPYRQCLRAAYRVSLPQKKAKKHSIAKEMPLDLHAVGRFFTGMVEVVM
jgi:hypothetical protein